MFPITKGRRCDDFRVFIYMYSTCGYGSVAVYIPLRRTSNVMCDRNVSERKPRGSGQTDTGGYTATFPIPSGVPCEKIFITS